MAQVNPSKQLRWLASFGILAELTLAPMCYFYPALGVPLALGFHTYILSMFPFASVMEWNLVCLTFSYLLSPSLTFCCAWYR